MPTADPFLVRVTTAERDGSSGPSQDRILIGPNFVVVLDGATQPDAGERDGGWLADQLGAQLVQHLESAQSLELVAALRTAIETVAARFELVPRDAPSTTVSIVRWSEERVDVLVLGDSPVVVRRRDGGVPAVRDDRLAQLVGREEYAAAIARGGFAGAHSDAWRSFVDRQRAVRNTAQGYWIAEAVPDAADHSVQVSWPTREIETIVLMTDGVADGVDVYGSPTDWAVALSVANESPQALVDAVHAAEESDSEGIRWPRSKLHDDKAVAVVRFDLTSG